MAQVEQRLAAAHPRAAAAPALAPAPALAQAPPPAAQPPTEESSDDSSDRRRKEKKEKKKKKKEKRERRERERSKGQGGGRGQPGGGGVKDEGEGEVVVDEGDGDGVVEVVDPPNDPPPPPSGFSKLWAPNLPPLERRGRSPIQPRCCKRGARGINPFFPPPPHSHVTAMWIFRRLIRCWIRRNEGKHGGTWGKDASRGGSGSGKPFPVPPLPPCQRESVWAPCPH